MSFMITQTYFLVLKVGTAAPAENRHLKLICSWKQSVFDFHTFGLFSILFKGQIIEIVKTLKEVQHGTEKHLFRNRYIYLN